MTRALTEDEIVRFSRQILLRPVGGVGQVRLCDTVVRVEGLPEVAAWLSAGGTPVQMDATVLSEAEAGFAGRAGETLRLPVPAYDPEGHVLAAPVERSTLARRGPVVIAGSRGGAWELVVGDASSCRACLAEACAGLERADVGDLGLISAMAALVMQRQLLGIGMKPSEGQVRETSQGGIDRPAPLPPCDVHKVVPRGEVWAELAGHLERAYPEEGCGAILRRDSDGALRFVALPNAHPAPREGFDVPGGALLRLERMARDGGEAIACFVHSHPDGEPVLSALDVAQAAPGGRPLWPGVAWAVVAVREGKASSARVFWWRDGSGFAGEDVAGG